MEEQQQVGDLIRKVFQMTRAEVLRKIGQIEQEEDNFKLFLKNIRNEEEHEAQCIHQDNRSLVSRFEECQGDKELLDLLEQEREILNKIQHTKNDFMYDLEEMQKEVKNKCELEIDELRRKLQSLEV